MVVVMVVMVRGQGYKVVHENESTKGTKCLVRERLANDEGELDVLPCSMQPTTPTSNIPMNPLTKHHRA